MKIRSNPFAGFIRLEPKVLIETHYIKKNHKFGGNSQVLSQRGGGTIICISKLTK